MALTLDSRHTKDTLQALSENIIGKKKGLLGNRGEIQALNTHLAQL